MRKTTINTITEAINAETRQQVRETLESLRAAIWRRIDARNLVLESETGYRLYLSMRGPRFERAWEVRQQLFSRENEDQAIITMIQRELAKL